MARLEQDRHRGVRDDDEAVGELHRGSEERARLANGAAAHLDREHHGEHHIRELHLSCELDVVLADDGADRDEEEVDEDQEQRRLHHRRRVEEVGEALAAALALGGVVHFGVALLVEAEVRRLAVAVAAAVSVAAAVPLAVAAASVAVAASHLRRRRRRLRRRLATGADGRRGFARLVPRRRALLSLLP